MRRGATLIEAMVAIGMLGTATSVAFASIADYRSRVAEVRKSHVALSCAEAQVERLRFETADRLRRRMRDGIATEGCDAPLPRLTLEEIRPPQAPPGTFAVIVEVGRPPHRVVLPFLAAREGP